MNTARNKALTPTLSRSTGRGNAAFTLIEMLVVISIIVLLAALLLVVVSRAYRQGTGARASADLASIATALEAYKQDFGDYPRVTGTNTGAAVLAKALIGPSPKPATADWKLGQFHEVTPPTPDDPGACYIALIDAPAGSPPTTPQPTSDWARISFRDGADGPAPDFRQVGFRTGPKTIADDPAQPGVPTRPGGRVWGPYVQPEKFLTRPDTGIFLDAIGNPILYFSASTAKPNVTTGANYVNAGGRPLYDANQNIRFFVRKPAETNEQAALKRIKSMLGDYDYDGKISTAAGEAAVELPYLLWSAGGDGVFGPAVSANPAREQIHETVGTDNTKLRHNIEAVRRSDDATNFR